ncbi:MBL fold metallo-hydrolase [Halobellus sp. GM3]|uniref:MBL fold metallo-hydrolase n=1 Tax=Halobellus sp. GM3 TaxID=3458410 RepID=UPI00403D73AB
MNHGETVTDITDINRARTINALGEAARDPSRTDFDTELDVPGHVPRAALNLLDDRPGHAEFGADHPPLLTTTSRRLLRIRSTESTIYSAIMYRLMPDVTEVRDGIYDITAVEMDDGRRYRAYLVDGPTPTLFDTGFDDSVESLIAGIEETGVVPERLVITHADGDHIGGVAGIVDEFDPQVLASEQSDLDGFDADRRYDDGDHIGDFEALHLPGHKPDSYGFVNEDAGVVISGDIVSGSDQRGLPAGYPILPPGPYSTDLIGLEKNLERLLEYSFDTILVYHGSSILDDAHERLDNFVNFPGKPVDD